MTRRPLLAAALLLPFLPGCDAAVVAVAETKTEAGVEAEADVEAVADAEVAADAAVVVDAGATVEITADAFKLAEVTALVQGGTIETAEELELAVNDPESDLNLLDIDADGQIDHVEVVEVRSDARVDFQFKVIPSSRATVVHAVDLASASVVADRASSEVSFSANFSAGIHFSAGATVEANTFAFVAPARFEASAVFVAQPLLAWAFVVDRPMYHSVYIEHGTGKWIPPGHLKHGHWKATGELPGHGNGHGHGGVHGKVKGHGKVDVGGHGKGGGASKGHGGSSSKGGSDKPAPPKKSSSHGSSPKKGGSSGPKGGGGGGGSKGGSSKGGSGGGGKGKK